MTRVTLDIQPAFAMRQDAFEGLRWSTLLTDFDSVMSAGYSVSLMTAWSNPTVTRLWVKRRAEAGVPYIPPAAQLGVVASDRPSATGTPESMQRLNPFGIVGPWSQRLPHFRPEVDPGPARHLQSEYMVPRERATAAIEALLAIGERIDRHLWATEIRSMTGDGLWLSPAYGDDRVAIHFSWRREEAAVAALTGEIEALLRSFGGRPHWGKIMHADAAQLAPLYPQLGAFRDLVRTYDPAGKFRNAFLDVHVLG